MRQPSAASQFIEGKRRKLTKANRNSPINLFANAADVDLIEHKFSGEINYRLSRSTGEARIRGNAAARTSDGASVQYDVATKSYTITGTGALPAVSFGPADQLNASSNNVITAYQRESGAKQENLSLFNPGAANTELALTYTSYGAYQAITDGTDVDVDTIFFTYGIKTAAADMPRTGSATYTTQIDGQFADLTGAYVLGGTSSFIADFSAASIVFSMTPVGQNVISGQLKHFDTHTINGSIQSALNGQKFSGSTMDSAGYSSRLDGYFFGPAAAEVGGTFSLVGNDGFGVGIVVGKKN